MRLLFQVVRDDASRNPNLLSSPWGFLEGQGERAF